MNRNMGVFVVSVLALVLATTVMAAPKGLAPADAENLVKGNTIEGVDVKWKKKMIWYFDPGGRLIKKDEHGNKGKGTWSIDKKGQFCFQDKHKKQEKCDPIIPRADGGYDAQDGQWRWNTVTPGNPHNL